MNWPRNLTDHRVGAIVSQVTILVLTLLKYKIAVKHGWGKLPIMILMVRDGTAAFFILLSTTFYPENLLLSLKGSTTVITTLTVVATSTQTEYAPLGNS